MGQINKLLQLLLNLNQLSSHLFWEYNIADIDLEKHKALIILRVLELGMIEDWKMIKEFYSFNEIKEAAINARNLDDVTLAFVDFYTDTPITSFRCYKQRQLIPHYSGY